jgi:hypothetical protein
MAMVKRLVISKGGQVSVPAAVRHRWRTRTVLAEDHGDYLVIRPAPEDPIAAVRGIFKKEMRGKPTLDEARAMAREEEAEIFERKWSRR